MTKLAQDIVPILQKYGVTKASLFGSCARGDQGSDSDVDILIQPPDDMGLAFVRLHRELEETLSCDVDLVTFNSISPYMKKGILGDQVKIL